MAFTVRIIESSNARGIDPLLARRTRSQAAVVRRVARIVDRVRRGGDAALIGFARRFDRLTLPIEVTVDEMQAAAQTLPGDVRRAIDVAAANIRKVARRQLPRAWTSQPSRGVSISQRVLPLDRVGCYVPGGRYPLPSSLLMTAIPADTAGVKEVIAVCPRPDATILHAARVAGVSRLFRLGGAHAVAALAYGTETVPSVDKIVGPGNAFVAAAKALVSPDCAIDFYAGPSEIVVVSSSGRPAWIAADLIAQAEHDPDARAVLVTPSKRLARRVAEEVAARMPAEGPASASLAAHGAIIVTRSVREAMALANAAAPEHLVVDSESLAAAARTAGAVFVGPWTAQVAGDYAIGSNHVLPTAGAARFRGGLNAADFVRLVSVQRVSRRGLARIAPTVTTLARAEGLEGHAASIEVRTVKGQASAVRGRASARPHD